MSAHGSTIVREVISSTSSGADVMSALPGLVHQLLDKEAWRKFTIPGGTVVEHATFGAFIEAAPPKGLGGRRNQLVALCGTDGDLAKRVQSLLLEEVPMELPHGNGPGRGHTEKRLDGTNSFPLPSSRPGNAEHVIARLKRDDPELAEKVVRGEVTPNAAAREKGWRKPRIILSTPEKVADSIRRFMPREARRRLAELLAEEDDPE